jgi:hypothetical protein
MFRAFPESLAGNHSFFNPQMAALGAMEDAARMKLSSLERKLQ